jgi:hypothetical protein
VEDEKEFPEVFILCSSLLPINQRLHSFDKWDEEAIERRGKELFERALLIWPAPLGRAKLMAMVIN